MKQHLCITLLAAISYCFSHNCEGVYSLGTSKLSEPKVESLDIPDLDSSLVVNACVNMSDSTVVIEKESNTYSYWLSRNSTICCTPQISIAHYENYISKRKNHRKTHCEQRYVSPEKKVTTTIHCAIHSSLDSSKTSHDSNHCSYPSRYDLSVEQNELKAIPHYLACMSSFPHNIIGKTFAHEKYRYVFCNGFYTNFRTTFYVKVTGICSNKE